VSGSETSSLRGRAGSIALGCLALLALDAFFLRWVWEHFELWGIWDWDYQQVLLESARRAVVDHGQLPLWNPYLGGGVSLAGNTLNHVWGPSFLPVLLFGTATGVKLCLPIYVIVGQLGMARLARARGLGPLAALFAAALFMLGGVFAQRLTHGHFEWIAIAWMPHVLASLHHASERLELRPVALGGLAFAFLFLDGGPYQFAFFSLFAGAYAVVLAIQAGRLRPVWAVAALGVVGASLAALKLFPVYEMVSRFPRPTDAVNFYGAPFVPTAGEILQQMFLSRDQGHDPSRWMPYVLNVGCYVGWVPLLLAAWGAATNLRRNLPWLALATLFLWIVMGPASPVDAWAVLHELPFLSSLRVPARFNVYLLMLIALMAGEGLQRWVRGGAAGSRRAVIAAALVALVAADLAWVNGQTLRVAFSVPPMELPRRERFEQYRVSPYLDRYRDTALYELHPNWPSSSFPAVLENRGVIRSYRTLRTPSHAVAFDDPGYAGEVLMVGQPPSALTATEVTPNRLSVRTDGRAGTVVFNVNHDGGWRAADAGTPDPFARGGLLAVELAAGTTHAALVYRPASFVWGATWSGLSVVALALMGLRARRGRRRSDAGA
jgi:hypothetical protein